MNGWQSCPKYKAVSDIPFLNVMLQLQNVWYHNTFVKSPYPSTCCNSAVVMEVYSGVEGYSGDGGVQW